MQTRRPVTSRIAASALACAGALCALSAQTAELSYFAVVPVSGVGTVGQLRPVKMALAGATPPAATIGVPYEFNLGALLSLDGPEGTTPDKVSWSVVSGELPAGLGLTADRISGVPLEVAAPGMVTFRAEYQGGYRDVGAIQGYEFEVHPAGIADFGGYRAWADGTFAQSCNEYRMPKDGAHAYEGATGDGVYRLAPNGLTPFDARCDMTTDGGGWTVFQRRVTQALDFYRGHNEYVAGFGSPTNEYWLGLERVRAMTASAKVLRIDMANKVGESRYAAYSSFSLGVAPDYVLNVRGFSGSADDGLSYHNGMGFTTYDYDVDARSDNCATLVHGAWWYNKCYQSNLNGSYVPYGSLAYGIAWGAWTGLNDASLQKTEMKFR
ncbi:fibrinogen-related domain-containing protein [Castellaniella sp. GW247-6E4]|uniref:fibrinogen-related domain-containing protein n=1 Tax=Castellaniella sp. GW247-6E4 TaxID=3140380 RepID=UPI003314DE91